jgi:hypothetical protein
MIDEKADYKQDLALALMNHYYDKHYNILRDV